MRRSYPGAASEGVGDLEVHTYYFDCPWYSDMRVQANGELVPEGGGDNIPLIREVLTIGRRESCDICFRFPNVSSLHCELSFKSGRWWLKDLGSTNGVKINGVRMLTKKPLLPGDKITIAKKTFAIDYKLPTGQRASEEFLEDMEEEDIMSQPLLERAGLIQPQRRPPGKSPAKPSKRDGGDSPTEIDIESFIDE